MKTENKYKISKSLKEVWEMKEKVYNEITHLNNEQLSNYFADTLTKLAKENNLELTSNPDGTKNLKAKNK